MEKGPSVIATSYKHLFDLIEDETPIVLKSVCEALRLCLPTMLYSTMYYQGKSRPPAQLHIFSVLMMFYCCNRPCPEFHKLFHCIQNEITVKLLQSM